MLPEPEPETEPETELQVQVEPEPESERSAGAAARAPFAAETHGNYSGTPPALSSADSAELLATLQNASIIVGMHPDQATEAIVRCALALGQAWAVVPCCVFATEFAHRRLSNEDVPTASERAHQEAAVSIDRPVVLFDDFVEYLQRMPVQRGLPRAGKLFLPWAGKNCVVFGGKK